jgi:hypothetical protein
MQVECCLVEREPVLHLWVLFVVALSVDDLLQSFCTRWGVVELLSHHLALGRDDDEKQTTPSEQDRNADAENNLRGDASISGGHERDGSANNKGNASKLVTATGSIFAHALPLTLGVCPELFDQFYFGVFFEFGPRLLGCLHFTGGQRRGVRQEKKLQKHLPALFHVTPYLSRFI